MLTIYGADLSSPANKVRYTANYLKLEYTYQRVSLRDGENKKPEFLKINPIGKIPVINDGGFILFESGAICRYLAEKAKSDIYPTELQQRAIVEQWIDFSTLHIAQAMSRVFYNRVLAPVIKAPVDENSIKDGLNFLDRFLPIVDGQLARRLHLVNERFSLADITALAALDPAEVSQVDVSKYSHLIKWRNRLKQQEFYTKCHQEYGESLKKFAGR